MISFVVTEKKQQQLLQRMQDCGLRETDLVETFIRGHGPGGQKINKTSVAVRLLHRPTGLEVKMQKTRSQAMNRFYARRRMCELLEQKQQDAQSLESQKQAKIRKQKQRRKRRTRSRRLDKLLESRFDQQLQSLDDPPENNPQPS